MKKSLLVICMLASSIMFAAETSNHQMFTPTEMQWVEGPASLPKGAKIAVLEGDPKNEGPFTMRLKFPANYHIPLHTHPGIEHITVISGTLTLGMGDDTKAKKLPVGSFAFMPANMQHFADVKGETVVQIHGVGPWGITYVKAEDDPRNKPEE